MRVAIDYTPALSQGAGIGRYTRALVAALIADTQDEYVLFHARTADGVTLKGVEPTQHVRVRSLPLGERALTAMWHRAGLRVPVETLVGAVDVVHGTNFLLPPRRRAAGVVTVLDLSFLLYPECADARLVRFLEQAVPRSVAEADLVVAISERTKQDLIALLDVEPSRVAVVPLGVEPHFRPVADPAALAAVRARLDLHEPFILTVGTLEPRKNLTTLLAAYAQLRQAGPLPQRLVVVGRPGWLYEDIYRTVERFDLRERVSFVGYVPDTDLPALYSAAEVFVYPSLYEGFGLPPLEALACGTPVVCSSSSSLPEVVGEAALLVSPTDVDALAAALQLVLSDDALCATLRARGLARAAGFTWAHAAARTRELYHCLARG